MCAFISHLDSKTEIPKNKYLAMFIRDSKLVASLPQILTLYIMYLATQQYRNCF